jgi:hypothetical protein
LGRVVGRLKSIGMWRGDLDGVHVVDQLLVDSVLCEGEGGLLLMKEVRVSVYIGSNWWGEMGHLQSRGCGWSCAGRGSGGSLSW